MHDTTTSDTAMMAFRWRGYEFNSYITKARARFGPEVTRRIIVGGFVPSAGHAGRYFLKALKVKSKLTQEINEAFKRFDVLIAPNRTCAAI